MTTLAGLKPSLPVSETDTAALTRCSALDQMYRLGRIAHRWRNPRIPVRLPSLIAPFQTPEELVLEISEIFYILSADGFDTNDIAQRLSFLLLPFQAKPTIGPLLEHLVIEHLRIADPFYLDMHEELLDVLLWPAKTWAHVDASHRLVMT